MRRISSELLLPEPTKSRILLEMAADLEALFEHHLARGVDEDEAARLSEEQVLASPEVLQSLVAVHMSGYQRWLSRAAGRLRWGFDALLFSFGVVPLVVISALAVAAPGKGISPLFLFWPLLGLGIAVAAIALWKAHQLLVRRVRSTAELHRGLLPLLFLAAISPLLAGLAFLVSLYEVAMTLMAGRATDALLFQAAGHVVQDATLLIAGLLLGIGAGLVWFVLVNRIATIEQEQSAALLASDF